MYMSIFYLVFGRFLPEKFGHVAWLGEWPSRPATGKKLDSFRFVERLAVDPKVLKLLLIN